MKYFNMITNKHKAKKMAKHILCDWKYKFNSTTDNLNHKWNDEICQCECKSYGTCKKDYSWNPRTYICENSKYLKSIADTSVIDWEKLYLLWILYQQKMTNTIATNAWINCHNKKTRYEIDCYILNTVLLVIILLLIITIIY